LIVNIVSLPVSKPNRRRRRLERFRSNVCYWPRLALREWLLTTR
jgi:hypothetical protein